MKMWRRRYKAPWGGLYRNLRKWPPTVRKGLNAFCAFPEKAMLAVSQLVSTRG